MCPGKRLAGCFLEKGRDILRFLSSYRFFFGGGGEPQEAKKDDEKHLSTTLQNSVKTD